MKTRYLFGMPFATLSVGPTEIEALVDTGFNGFLLIPESVARACKFKALGSIKYFMADGKQASAKTYEAEISWLHSRIRIEAITSKANFSLIGMQLLTHAKTVIKPMENILTIEPA